MFLVGFMGSGKSSVGEELARRLHWGFIDLDRQIESREHRSIPEIFQQSGESGFRIAETAALRQLADSLRSDSVIALGGGAFGQVANRELISRWPSVFLEASVDELWRRVSEDRVLRPLRKDREQFSLLYAQRLPSYRQATITVVTSDRDIPSICLEIEGKLNLVETPASKSSSVGSHLGGSEPGGTQ